jgi:3-methyladenine DNA glycosylase AlkC
MSAENPNALKHLYGKDFLKRLGMAFTEAREDFNERKLKSLLPRLEKLEMKPRVILVRDFLHEELPKDYSLALTLILKAHETGILKGFDYWPLTEYVKEFGLGEVEKSLKAMEVLTVPFTSEFAVRPFLNLHTKESLRYLLQCSKSKNVHVRRWASEGSRPRLPWGERLPKFIKDPSLTRAILEELKFDEELYVRKSVANHLNDIAKDHPEFVVKVLTAWKKEAKDRHGDKIQWIIRHSLRTLIKDGHPSALKLLGVNGEAEIKIMNFQLHGKKFKLNDRLEFEFEIESLSKKAQKLVVDYKIHFQRSREKTRAKVFKLKTFDLGAGGRILIKKGHHLKVVTTREHYPGKHVLEIQINGKVLVTKAWDLELH